MWTRAYDITVLIVVCTDKNTTIKVVTVGNGAKVWRSVRSISVDFEPVAARKIEEKRNMVRPPRDKWVSFTIFRISA